MVTYARTVGTAPGTTTLSINVNGLGIQCYPVPPSMSTYKPDGTPAPAAPPKHATVYSDEALVKGAGFGYIMDRAEIVRTLPPTGGYLPGYTDERHEVSEGIGFDGALGAIPTDAEMGRGRCYTPVHSGWVYLQQQQVRRQAAAAQKSASLGEALGADADTLEALKRYQRLSLIISSLSVIGMVTLAGVGVYRAIKDYEARPIVGGR